LSALGVEVCDDDLASFRRDRAASGRTDAAGTSRDDDDPTSNTSHRSSLERPRSVS
jgi:hypothetical protein